MTEPVIEVVGVGASGWDSLSAAEQRLVLDAEVVLGGPRHLQMVPATGTGPVPQLQAWPSPLRPALPELLRKLSGRRIAVLASGDPLLSGVGTTLIELLGADAVRVHPQVSSAALARARLGWSAEQAVTVSLVGRSLDRLRRELAPGARLVVLSGGSVPPAQLAAILVEEGYRSSRMTLLGELGSPSEMRMDHLAADWPDEAPVPDLHLVGLECRLDPDRHGRSLVPGLPDDCYDHDGQLTKRVVRAAALAHLEPFPGQTLWDVGAGAGSIAIEWCRQHPRNRAVAFERRPDRLARIRTNAARLGVGHQVAVIEGDASAVLDPAQRPPGQAQPPTPDAVFVGGGTDEALLNRCYAALRPGGRLVVHCVTVETEQVVLAARRRNGGQLSRIGVERLEAIGSYQGWRPSRAITQWAVRKPATAGAAPDSSPEQPAQVSA